MNDFVFNEVATMYRHIRLAEEHLEYAKMTLQIATSQKPAKAG